VINPQFTGATEFRNGIALVNVAGKSGIIDKTGTFLMNPGQITLTMEIGDDLIAARNENGFGYVDRNGAWVIQPSPALEVAGRLREGAAVVRIAGEAGVIDKSGAIVWGAYKGQPLADLGKIQTSELGAIADMRSIVTAEVSYYTTFPTAGYADQLTK